MKLLPQYTCALLFFLWLAGETQAQQLNLNQLPADSWQQTMQQKSGTISVLWYDIEPFIYKDEHGKLSGVEYEIMENFAAYVRAHYRINLNVNWVNAGSFENIYDDIKSATKPGFFGWSFYSITDERKKEIQFTPAYMPDLNIIVTNNSMPEFATSQEFLSKINGMKAFTMASTTMEQDILKMKKNFYPSLPVSNKNDDYDVLKEIASTNNGFGYVPLSIYITALQKGIKVKRQQVLMVNREGFAGILPLHSDWVQPANEYFNTNECRMMVQRTIRKYLGSEVSDLVFAVSASATASDTANKVASDINLLTLEKEIVTKRLIESAVETEKERNTKNILIIFSVITIGALLLFYRRMLEKQKINGILKNQNDIISEQKKEIEKINNNLQLKLLQSQLNPHFIFNSLNAIQYFVGLNDKKAALLYISSFSKFLRQFMNAANGITNSVVNECDTLQQYLKLEKQRFNDKFNFNISIKGIHEMLETRIPSLLVHSFAENALYHGVLNRNDNNGFIDIVISADDHYIFATVKDNGVGRTKASEINRKKNITSSNNDFTKERIDLLNVNAIEKIEIETSDIMEYNEIKGTKVSIKIPIAFAKQLN